MATVIEQQDLTRQAKLLQYANSKRNVGEFNDVTIEAGAESIAANRMVLPCYSKFFESIFLSPLKEKYQNTVEIKEFDGKAIKVIIDYIYTGSIKINQENVITLLGVADFLQVGDVKKLCFDHLESSLTVDSCLDVVKAAVLYNNPSPLQQTYDFISDNVDEVIEGDNFKDLSKSDMTSLLKNLNRDKVPEISLYKANISWVKWDQTRESDFSSLFSLLNLQKLPPQFVTDTIASEPLVKSSTDCLNAVVTYMIPHMPFKKQKALKLEDVPTMPFKKRESSSSEDEEDGRHEPQFRPTFGPRGSS